MEVLSNLLLLYAGLLLINVALSGWLWYQHRTRLHSSLLMAWLGLLVGLVAQGLLDEGVLAISLGFSTVFGGSLGVAYLLAGVTRQHVPVRAYLLLFVFGVSATAALSTLEAPFWAVALPVAVAVAAPMFHAGIRGLWAFADRLSPMGKLLHAGAIVYALHGLDFPFLREQPELAPVGFTIAILTLFALSVAGPAVVLERVAEERVKQERLRMVQSEFFANVSHELRTPLTLILSPLETVLSEKHGPVPASVRAHLISIRRNAVRLLRLINNLLDLSKLEAGKTFLRYAPLRLRPFLQSTVASFEALAEQKGVILTFDGEDVEPVVVDEEKIGVIVQNLLANALKFTSEGSVTLRLREDATSVIVEVADTGIGIQPQDLEPIFERFGQADTSTTRRFDGSGIGLALAKELVELHGGSISVSSVPDEGSSFTVRLPKGEDHVRDEIRDRRAVDLPVAHERRVSDRDPMTALVPAGDPSMFAGEGDPDWGGEVVEPTDGPRVLVVEDNGDMRGFLRRVLGTNYRTMAAADGKEGEEKAKRHRPDLVISDVMMPVRSGYELTRALRDNPSTREIPIILLTAKRGVEPAVEGFEHGADDYIGKPFSTRELLARVRVQLRLRDLAHQLAQAQKTSMLATLAAGLAHEIRNPVNAIVNSVPLLRKEARVQAQSYGTVDQLLDLIDNGAQRIDTMVQDLLDFTHLDRAEITDWDPSAGADSAVKLLQPRFGAVRAEKDYRHTGTVEARVGPMNQAILNIVDNALRAVGERGTIRITTRDDDGGVRISIADDGPGIPAEVQARIFDPFFTTRQVGQGVGLGLHLCRQVIEGHGGSLAVDSSPGEGATFHIWLPRRMSPQLRDTWALSA